VLPDLWELGPAEVISVVGAGGKSTLLESLAREYERRGGLVLLTTTTKMMPPRPGGRPLITGETLEAVMAGLDRLQEAGGLAPVPGSGHLPPVTNATAATADGASCSAAPPPTLSAGARLSPVVGRSVLANGKLDGLPLEWIAALRDRAEVAAVVVEADGAARLPLKAPAEYEPVVPPCTSVVVAMCGLEAQRAYLEPDQVHRAELLAELLDLPLGAPVPPERLPEALVLGYQDAVPSWARFLLLFNKADLIPPDPALVEAAREAPVESWLGAVGARPVPLLQCLRARDAAPAVVILAAGRASRMGGRPKVLLSWEGRTLVTRAVETAGSLQASGPVIVVIGHEAERVKAELDRAGAAGGFPRILVVRNPCPEEGMGSSLRRGALAAGPRDLVVMLADQPLVTTATLERLLAAFRAHPTAAGAVLGTGSPPGEGESGKGAPTATGTWGPPLVIHRSLAPQLACLAGSDGGGRGLLSRYETRLRRVPAVGGEASDIDTEADWTVLGVGLPPDGR